jgi:hypothetical protein
MIKQIRAFVAGESYWKVIFQSGKELSELDKKPYLDGDKVLRMRSVEWLEDIIGSGDLRNVKEAMLCTPQGTAHFTVTEPYTVFQLSRGTMAMLTGERIKNLQVVGVVTDKDTGECECAIWDQQSRQLYTMFNNVKDFQAWREGVIPIGMINLKALDLRGVAA